MTQPIEKTLTKRPLVHHPSDVLDAFCRYEVTDRNWLDFDQAISEQLLELEFANRQYIRQQPQSSRR